MSSPAGDAVQRPARAGAPPAGGSPQVLCIGETMAMLTPTDGADLVHAEAFTLTAGGAESNVAQHMAEIGVPTAWISAVGTDPLGERVLRQVRASGVDTRWVRHDPGAQTGLYVKDPA